jgi:DNA-binding Lrp family transcriptional regulator
MAPLDEIDRALVAALILDGRRSYAALGADVGLSASAVQRRVRRLERERVITGWAARVDPQALGWSMEAHVALTFSGNVSPAAIRALLADQPEVVEAFTVTGPSDAGARLLGRDAGHLEQVIERIRSSRLVARTETEIVMSRLVSRSYGVATSS